LVKTIADNNSEYNHRSFQMNYSLKKSHFAFATILFFSTSLFLIGCSSMSTLPKEDNVKVSRKPADKDCVFLSKLEGRTMSKRGTEEDALKDLVKEAANKGANFLEVKTYSSAGTAVTGLVYKCP